MSFQRSLAKTSRNAIASSSRVRISSGVAVTPARRQSLATSSARREQFAGACEPTKATSFPCVDQHESREARLREANLLKGKQPQQTDALQFQSSASSSSSTSQAQPAETEKAQDGPEPAYANIVSGYKTYHHPETFQLNYGSSLPSFDLAYETWGQLNADKSNAILIHTGLSASSHAKSTAENKAEGWWERFIGPDKPIDTNKFFVICTNVLGGCYGSTGPSSLHPSDNKPWATRFPILSLFDMVRAQFKLLDHLEIKRLHASVGSSMGGQQCLAAAHLEPERVGKVASISGTARSSPGSIAMRYAQRSVLMADQNWNRGFYYDGSPPHTGMKLARQIGTITYRSGPEWEQRFGRQRRLPTDPINESPITPALCPDFLIETYLDHQGEQWCLKYDANSFLYISKAMDLFDMSSESLDELARFRSGAPLQRPEVLASNGHGQQQQKHKKPAHISSIFSSHSYLPSLAKGLSNLSRHPMLILGAQSDILFPIDQQRELAEAVRMNGNKEVAYYELDSPYGHDTFLIDLQNVGSALSGFLSLR